jgi:phosphoribosylamine---glycine ligase
VQTAAGPSLLEFNARFGDPETQVILPLLASDLGDLLSASAIGRVGDVEVSWHERAAVTVVLASGGYPEAYELGRPISGLETVGAGSEEDVAVFHAGTARDAGGALVTAGGRVLDVTAWAADLASARERAYAAVRRIDVDGLHYRTDIAAGIQA